MILPTKHTTLKNSILNLGAIILKKLDSPRTISEVWNEMKILGEIRSFEFFVLSLDFLYSIGLIKLDEGMLLKAK